MHTEYVSRISYRARCITGLSANRWDVVFYVISSRRDLVARYWKYLYTYKRTRLLVRPHWCIGIRKSKQSAFFTFVLTPYRVEPHRVRLEEGICCDCIVGERIRVALRLSCVCVSIWMNEISLNRMNWDY